MMLDAEKERLQRREADRRRYARAGAKVCVHCQDPMRKVNRPRGLCWRCDKTPGVRELYATNAKYGRKGSALFAGAAPLPDHPTVCVPGSEGKIRVMAARAAQGRSIFHPLDVDMGGN